MAATSAPRRPTSTHSCSRQQPPTTVNRLDWTALLEAIILGEGRRAHTETVRALVDAGADVSIADGDGVTPIAHARERGYDAIVAILRAA